MGRIAVLGDPERIHGWALAGVLLVPTRTMSDVPAAWAALPAEVDLVLLTRDAADVLGARTADRPVAVLP